MRWKAPQRRRRRIRKHEQPRKVPQRDIEIGSSILVAAAYFQHHIAGLEESNAWDQEEVQAIREELCQAFSCLNTGTPWDEALAQITQSCEAEYAPA